MVKFFHKPSFWIILSFIFWLYCFRGFLSLDLIILNDAVSYFERTKYLVDNLMKGVFPLWDPFWFHGAPNDFFLRRLGAFNPLYLIMGFVESLGVRYSLVYLWGLAFYYWSGTIAFYFLARRIYQDSLIAYAGYLILLFSALGTRIFDTYMLLVTVPVLWFFYFLVAFTQKPQKFSFLGLSLTFMILASTYIPFYFLGFLVLFLFLFAMVYFLSIPQMIRRYFEFFKSHKILVFVCLVVVLCSFIPLYGFYQSSTQGQIVLPERHGSSQSNSPLVVPIEKLNWGAVEDLVFSLFHSDLSAYKFAIVYVPFFAIIVFILGLFSRISRRAILLSLSGLVLLCCIIPHGLPFYDFLYQHLFFLKYFRNLHFFIWFILIPLFVLLVLEHWQLFQHKILIKGQKSAWICVVFVHMVLWLFVWFKGDAIVSTYIMLLLSFMFWSLRVMGRLQKIPTAFALLTAIVLIQPIQTYNFLSLRADKGGDQYYRDVEAFQRKLVFQRKGSVTSFAVPGKKVSLYYASSYFSALIDRVDALALDKYLEKKFILYDQLTLVDSLQFDFKELEQSFMNNTNNVYVFTGKNDDIKSQGTDPDPSLKALAIIGEDSKFKILSFDANHIRLFIDVPYEKFLVYNDSYSPSWVAKINGQKTEIYQANIAFKGVWLKAGQSIVEFKYGRSGEYWINYFLLSSALLFLVGILWYSKNRQ